MGGKELQPSSELASAFHEPFSGTVGFTAGVNQDEAAIEPSHEDLVTQQRRIESVVNLLPVPLLLVDATSARVVLVNRAAQPTFASLLPVGGTGDHSYFSDSEGRRLRPQDLPWARLAATGEVEPVTLDWHTPQQRSSFLVNCAFMSGGARTIVVALQDISALKRAQSELQEAVRARDDFLSIVAHELRTPLTAMQIHVYNLLRLSQRETSNVAPELVARKADAIGQSVNRLAKMISDLLEVARLSTGRFKLQPKACDLSELVREIVARFEPEFRQAGAPLHARIAEGVHGIFDRTRVDLIITNLLTNALKFSDGQPVDLILEADGSQASLHVRDRGIGIALEDQGRIFERFERAASQARYGGFGLGLWLSRSMLEVMGGTIRVSSQPGLGSTFTVLLPLP